MAGLWASGIQSYPRVNRKFFLALLIPIIAGCAHTVVTKISFNAAGLYGALISNVGFVLRNIYSKQSLYDFKHVDELNFYVWISIVSFLYLFPVTVFIEGSHWVQGYRTAITGATSPLVFCSWVLLSGVFYHLYNQSLYQALDEISPLTFLMGNTMNRVVVIIATAIAFRNPMRQLNALGSAIAIFRTFLHSQATTAGKSRKKVQMISKKDVPTWLGVAGLGGGKND